MNAQQQQELEEYLRTMQAQNNARRQPQPQQRVDGIGGITRATPGLVRWGLIGLGVILASVAASQLIGRAPAPEVPKQELPASEQLAGPSGAEDPNPALIAAIERLEAENQHLRQQNNAALNEIMAQARDTRAWFHLNMCIVNCEGRTNNPRQPEVLPLENTTTAQLVGNSSGPVTAPAASGYGGPRDLNILIAPPAVQQPPAQPTEPFGVEFAREYLRNNRVPLIRPRNELGIPDSSFQLPGRAYDNDVFMRSVEHFRGILYNQPEVYLAQVISTARSSPTSFQVEGYDALLYVELLRVQQY